MKRKLFFPLLASVMLAATAGLSVACSNSDNTTKNDPQEEWLKTVPESVRLLAGFEKFYTKMDYSIADNWLNVPATIDKDVDVFFIYPTCYMPTEEDALAVCDIDNGQMREGAQRMFRIQASVFAESCNIS